MITDLSIFAAHAILLYAYKNNHRHTYVNKLSTIRNIMNACSYVCTYVMHTLCGQGFTLKGEVFVVQKYLLMYVCM